MKKSLLVASAALCVASVAFAQPYPANGYIGVYQDAAGTDCCSDVPAFTPTTLYVIATLAGETAAGITGAEFRLEFSEVFAASASISFAADPAANVVIGNPIDATPNSDPATGSEGVNLAFQTCRDGATQVTLGTLQVIVFNAAWTGVDVRTMQRTPPGNPDPIYACPLFTLCDGPFTKVCLTIPAGAHGQSVNFVSGINRGANCNTSCVAVAVNEKTWSAVKDLYRN